MVSNSDLIKDRLSSIMLADRGSGVSKLVKVLKSDLYTLLKDYMSLTPEDVALTVTPVPGGYQLSVTAVTERFLEIGHTLD